VVRFSLSGAIFRTTQPGSHHSTDADTGDQDTALALYEAGVTALVAAARDNPTSDSLARLLRGIETQRNRVAIAEHALIAEAESQGVAHEHQTWYRGATTPTPPHSSEQQ
jgi:hypothetical protein